MSLQRYLVDCSALYPLILKMREKIILYKDAFSILDLTIYEVGNVLWKEYGKGRIRDLKSADQRGTRPSGEDETDFL